MCAFHLPCLTESIQFILYLLYSGFVNAFLLELIFLRSPINCLLPNLADNSLPPISLNLQQYLALLTVFSLLKYILGLCAFFFFSVLVISFLTASKWCLIYFCFQKSPPHPTALISLWKSNSHQYLKYNIGDSQISSPTPLSKCMWFLQIVLPIVPDNTLLSPILLMPVNEIHSSNLKPGN